MQQRDSKAIVRRYFNEVWNKGNLDAADEIIALGFSVEGCGGAVSGLEAVKLYVSCYREVCPNIHFTLLSLIEEGDKVVACWLGTGTQVESDCEETAASFQKAPVVGLSIYRIAGGKIMEAWAGSDHACLSTDAARRLGITRNNLQ